MEALENFIKNYANQYPLLMFILTLLGSIIPIASAYVALTPSKTDDEWFHKLEENKYCGWAVKFFARFSLLQRKESEMKKEEPK